MSNTWKTITHRGTELNCIYEQSPNKSYGIAYYSEKNDTDGYVFALRDGTVKRTHRIASPQSVDIANDGTYAVADWIAYGQSTPTILQVYHISNGELQFEHEREASAGLTAVSPDGDYVALCPYNSRSYIYRCPDSELLTVHQNRLTERHTPQFTRRDGSVELQFIPENAETDDHPLYAISPDGRLRWTSDKLETLEYYDTISLDQHTDWTSVLPLLCSDYETTDDESVRQAITNIFHEADLTEVSEGGLETLAELLSEHFNIFKTDEHKRVVAATLGEAYYRLARMREDTMGTADSFWTAVEDADHYYHESLPSYDGKEGLAKLRRLQAKIYRNQGKSEAAYACYDEIQRIADWADVEVLSEADERRFKNLSDQGVRGGSLPHGTPVRRRDVTWS